MFAKSILLVSFVLVASACLPRNFNTSDPLSTEGGKVIGGTVKDAIGTQKGLNNKPCSIMVDKSGDKMNVTVSVENKKFSETNLVQSFGGADQSEPKYRITRERAADKPETVVVFVDRADNSKITYASAFKSDNSYLGFAYSFSCVADAADGSVKTLEGTVTEAVGKYKDFMGQICSVTTRATSDNTIDATISIGGTSFSETDLEQSFSGINQNEPKYRIKRERAVDKPATVVVFVDPADKSKITHASAFETNNSERGFAYSLICTRR